MINLCMMKNNSDRSRPLFYISIDILLLFFSSTSVLLVGSSVQLFSKDKSHVIIFDYYFLLSVHDK